MLAAANLKTKLRVEKILEELEINNKPTIRVIEQVRLRYR